MFHFPECPLRAAHEIPIFKSQISNKFQISSFKFRKNAKNWKFHVQHIVNRVATVWVSPFGNRRIKGCLAPPRRVSPPTASFLGSYHQRHPPFALKVWRNACLKIKNFRHRFSLLLRVNLLSNFQSASGPWGIRTLCLMYAKHVLYQLS